MSEITDWSEDTYWTEALEEANRLQQQGKVQITLDLDAIFAVVYHRNGPAYKLMEAMVSVHEQEGWDGCKGAPRVLLALLVRLAELSQERRNEERDEEIPR